MMKEFNRYNLAKPYSMYKTVFNTICSHIDSLNTAKENRENRVTIEYFAVRLKDYTYVFEGYTDCLFDLHIINEVEYNSFYEFVKAIRIECNYIIW